MHRKYIQKDDRRTDWQSSPSYSSEIWQVYQVQIVQIIGQKNIIIHEPIRTLRNQIFEPCHWEPT